MRATALQRCCGADLSRNCMLQCFSEHRGFPRNLLAAVGALDRVPQIMTTSLALAGAHAVERRNAHGLRRRVRAAHARFRECAGKRRSGCRRDPFRSTACDRGSVPGGTIRSRLARRVGRIRRQYCHTASSRTHRPCCQGGPRCCASCSLGRNQPGCDRHRDRSTVACRYRCAAGRSRQL